MPLDKPGGLHSIKYEGERSMRTITAKQIANMYTLVQIEKQIATYQSMLDSSIGGGYIDTTKTSVTPNPDKIELALDGLT